jgi:hypothetical protein
MVEHPQINARTNERFTGRGMPARMVSKIGYISNKDGTPEVEKHSKSFAKRKTLLRISAECENRN